MSRYAHIVGKVVANVIELDPKSAWRPEGGYVVPSDDAQIGWLYDGANFIDPTPPPKPAPPPLPKPPSEVDLLRERIALLEEKLATTQTDVESLKTVRPAGVSVSTK